VNPDLVCAPWAGTYYYETCVQEITAQQQFEIQNCQSNADTANSSCDEEYNMCISEALPNSLDKFFRRGVPPAKFFARLTPLPRKGLLSSRPGDAD